MNVTGGRMYRVCHSSSFAITLGGMDGKKFEIAHHETGHSVMALICRQEVRSISLKEMASPRGTDKYLGSTSIPFQKKPVLTVNEAICRMKIALGGFASEILLFDGSTKVGGDDLTSAVSSVETMMQSQDFRNLAATLPVPPPGALDMIGDPTVRAVIDFHIGVCVEELIPFKPLIHTIAERLCECEELMGEQVTQLFDSFVATTMR